MFRKSGVLILLMAAPVVSWAYLDPGTGMSFVSGIGSYLLALLVVAIGTVVLFFKRLLALVKRGWAYLKNKFHP